MRWITTAIICSFILGGWSLAASAANRPTTRPSTRPTSSEELKILGMYVGTWEVKTTIEGPPPSTKTSTVKVTWTVDHQYVQHRRIVGEKGVVAVELMTYDPIDGLYRSWSFEPNVPPILLTGRWDEKNRRIIWTGQSPKVFYKIIDRFLPDGSIASKVTLSDSSDRELDEWESKATRIPKK